MSMQGDNKVSGLLTNPWAQIGLITVVVIVLIVAAAHYIW
jgi:hypothetical protein